MDVRANAAVSVDGKLSTRRREQVSISGPEDFSRVDRLRAERDAVLVGVGTVLADDPSLTVEDEGLIDQREARGERSQPARVVADSTGRTPLDARVLDDAAETYLLVAEAAPARRIDALESAGATAIVAGDERVDLASAFETLESRGVERLLVEGGGELLFSCFSAGLVDELTLYLGSVLIGGRDAPTLVDGEGFVDGFPELSLESIDRVDDGVLLDYEVDR